jgi:hypothetical protein
MSKPLGANGARSIGLAAGLLGVLALVLPGFVSGQEPAPPGSPADLLAAAHQRLIGHTHIRADLQELVAVKEPPFRMSGSYVSAGLKLRLEFTAKLPGNVQGSLLEVCDGERLWSVTELPGGTRVTRRDVRQILAAMEQARGRPEQAATVDLALGGLPALLTSLTRSMQFHSVKAESLSGRGFWVLSGKWKPDVVRQLTGSDAAKLPPHIPEAVRVYLAQETLFPERIVYLRLPSGGGGLKPVLDLRFTNVVLNGPIDAQEFEFTPPENVEPEDVTRQYLDQLFPPAGKDASAAGSGTAAGR